MNKFISFLFVACALIASVQCGSYGGYASGADSANVQYAQSYSLGASNGGYGSQSAGYGSQAGGYASQAAPSYQSSSYRSRPRFSVQPLWTQEIYPGRNQYKSYHSAPYYSQIALPVVPSAPLANLYASQDGGYGSSAGSYGGSSY